MLKISLIESAKQRRLVVEGKLIAPWAAELRSASDKAKADLRGREFVIEMKHVTAISHEGENVIVALIKRGTRFRCDGVFTRHVVKQLTRRAKQELRNTDDRLNTLQFGSNRCAVRKTSQDEE